MLHWKHGARITWSVYTYIISQSALQTNRQQLLQKAEKICIRSTWESFSLVVSRFDDLLRVVCCAHNTHVSAAHSHFYIPSFTCERSRRERDTDIRTQTHIYAIRNLHKKRRRRSINFLATNSPVASAQIKERKCVTLAHQHLYVCINLVDRIYDRGYRHTHFRGE